MDRLDIVVHHGLFSYRITEPEIAAYDRAGRPRKWWCRWLHRRDHHHLVNRMGLFCGLCILLHGRGRENL